MNNKIESLKPFDLQKALAGDKFARELDMKEPDEWHYFNTSTNNLPITCIFDGEMYNYGINGNYYSHQSKCLNDLVMLPKTKKLWLRVAKKADMNGTHFTTHALDKANKCFIATDDHCVLVEIEIEVDE